MSRPRLRLVVFVLPLLCWAGGCEEQARDQAREVADNAARQGVEQAREVADQAARGAGAEINKARARYEVDAKVGAAAQHFSVAMDEAAAGFAALAESGQASGDALADKLERTGDMIAVAPAAVVCDEASAARLCRVDPDLIAVLKESPMSLARDAVLRPRKGQTGAGIALVSLSEGGLSRALGLREGDILLELNGVALSSFDAISSLDEALAGQVRVSLIYERGGARENLVIMQQVRGSGSEDLDAR